MVKILVKEGIDDVSIIKRHSPYSIEGNVTKIMLSVGCNELSDLKYGFFLDFLSDIERIEEIDLSEYDTSDILEMSIMFNNCYASKFNLSRFNTSKVKSMDFMFSCCENLVELDLSSFDTNNVVTFEGMFIHCKSLERIYLNKFDLTKAIFYNSMFYGCDNLKFIKCTEEFKKWCLENQSIIGLPDSMREGGSGIWEIVD